MLPHRHPVVVVPHDPHDLAPQPRRERLEQGPQLAVGGRLARVNEVAGDHQRGRGDPGRLDALKQLLQPCVGVNRPVQALLAGDQVGVRKMKQNMIRTRVLRVPQYRHRTVASPARRAIRYRATNVRQQAPGARRPPGAPPI